MRIFERILCPIDFSETSVKALQCAESLAKEFESELIVLHTEEAQDADYEKAQERIAEFLQGVRVKHQSIISTGDAAERISHYAKDTHSSAIVIGTRGLKGFLHHVLGSTTEKVIRNVSIPVVTITPNCKGSFNPKNSRILMGLANLNEIPASSFRLRKIIRGLNASLSLIHVVDPKDSMFDSNFYANPIMVSSFETSQYQNRLLELGMIMIKEPPAEALIRVGNPAEEILKEADRYDFVCMGAKDGNLRNRFINSYVYKVICEAPVPVMTLKRV